MSHSTITRLCDPEKVVEGSGTDDIIQYSMDQKLSVYKVE